MTTAIDIDRISKRYRLGGEQSLGYNTLRDRIAAIVDPSLRGARSRREELWALRDISFTVEEGEALGLIGPNGAGKSTLLKILSRITAPTSGRARLRGRVASLLEVGTGFHPELTGRENIFLNGTILGMKQAEIRRKFDDIVAFAETERFLDTPIKRYSSGMYVRLAFAVAAHLTPEILLVDEVLAVGDFEFQKRCLGRMQEVARSGRTVVFVSHNLAAVENLCQRAVLLKQGSVEMIGPSAEVVAHYLSGRHGDSTANLDDADREGTGRARIVRYELLDACEDSPLGNVEAGAAFRIRLHLMVQDRLTNPIIGLALLDPRGQRIFVANTADPGSIPAEIAAGSHSLDCVIQNPNVLPGTYRLELWITDVANVSYADHLYMVGRIDVVPTDRWTRSAAGQADEFSGFIYVESAWGPLRERPQ